MEKDYKTTSGHVSNRENWVTALAKSKDSLSGYSKDVRDVIKSVMDKIDKGIDHQIAFKEAITDADLTGMEMDKMEKRTDISAILYDLYQVDVNPVNIDKTLPDHAE